MKILALEFSSAKRSVAFFDSATNGVKSSASEFGGRATRAFGLIEQALEKAQIRREEIECLAIGIGPGSYAGIRSSIAIAQGWQLASGLKIVAISSAKALAAVAQDQKIFGKVNIVIDAQRNEFYLATYDISEAALHESEELRIVSADEVRRRMDLGEPVLGPDLGQWFTRTTLVYPEASVVARLAAKSSAFISGNKVEPIYLRETTFVKAPPPRIIS